MRTRPIIAAKARQMIGEGRAPDRLTVRLLQALTDQELSDLEAVVAQEGDGSDHQTAANQSASRRLEAIWREQARRKVYRDGGATPLLDALMDLEDRCDVAFGDVQEGRVERVQKALEEIAAGVNAAQIMAREWGAAIAKARGQS